MTHDKGSNDKTYANISNISSVPSAIRKAGLPEGVNPLVWFDIDHIDMEVYTAFPDYLKNIISSAPEWKMKQEQPDVAPSDLDDDIPFN
jgi:hypothetical protein